MSLSLPDVIKARRYHITLCSVHHQGQPQQQIERGQEDGEAAGDGDGGAEHGEAAVPEVRGGDLDRGRGRD